MNKAMGSVPVGVKSEFVQRGIAAIEKTKRAGGGIPAEVVIAKLEAKLAAARVHRNFSLPT